MPKNPQASDYRMSVDHVIETGQVTADQKIAILVTAGSTRLQLELEPADALRRIRPVRVALRGGRGMGGSPLRLV